MADDDVGQRGLAGAVGAHHGVDLPVGHREVDALEDFLARDAGMQIIDF